ncbi:DUF7563 family protein [Natronosalvus halobius]
MDFTPESSTCLRCGRPVSIDYRRTHGDENGFVEVCPRCRRSG